MGGPHVTAMPPACPQPTHYHHIDTHNPPIQLIWGGSSSKNMKIHIYSAAGPNPYMQLTKIRAAAASDPKNSPPITRIVRKRTHERNNGTTGIAVTNGTTGFCAAEATGEIIADVAPPAMELFDAGEIATGIWAADDLGAGDTIPDVTVDLGVGFFFHCPFAV